MSYFLEESKDGGKINEDDSNSVTEPDDHVNVNCSNPECWNMMIRMPSTSSLFCTGRCYGDFRAKKQWKGDILEKALRSLGRRGTGLLENMDDIRVIVDEEGNRECSVTIKRGLFNITRYNEDLIRGDGIKVEKPPKDSQGQPPLVQPKDSVPSEIDDEIADLLEEFRV